MQRLERPVVVLFSARERRAEWRHPHPEITRSRLGCHLGRHELTRLLLELRARRARRQQSRRTSSGQLGSVRAKVLPHLRGERHLLRVRQVVYLLHGIPWVCGRRRGCSASVTCWLRTKPPLASRRGLVELPTREQTPWTRRWPPGRNQDPSGHYGRYRSAGCYPHSAAGTSTPSTICRLLRGSRDAQFRNGWFAGREREQAGRRGGIG